MDEPGYLSPARAGEGTGRIQPDGASLQFHPRGEHRGRRDPPQSDMKEAGRFPVGHPWVTPEDTAIHFFQEVVSLADEMNFAQAQIEARLCLVHAFLGMDDLPRAEIAVKEAGRHTFRLGTPNVFALQGVIALRQSDVVGACEAFQEAIAQADELLQHSHFIWNALYGKALALAGLALCKDAGLVPAAAETYEQAQAVSSNLGILKGALYELDALLKADPKGLLKPVRAVVAGKTTLPRRHAGTRKTPARVAS